MESVVLRSNSGWGDLHIYEGSTLAALVLSPRRGGGGPTRRGGTDIREDNLMPSLEDWLFELYSQLFKYYSAGSAGRRRRKAGFLALYPPGCSHHHRQVSTCSQIPRGLIIPNTNMDGPARLPFAPTWRHACRGRIDQ